MRKFTAIPGKGIFAGSRIANMQTIIAAAKAYEYNGKMYDKNQMAEINEGFDKGLDVSVYANPRYSRKQMAQIRMGLESGVDVTVFANPRYNADAMEQIRRGLESGVDVSIYADLKFDADQMKQIREGLEEGLDVSVYADPKFDKDQMTWIYFGLRNGLDVSIYADPKFDYSQMIRLYEGLEAGIDMGEYADPTLTSHQLEDIVELYKIYKFDSDYVNDYVDWIRADLDRVLDSHDVAHGARAGLDFDQMNELHHQYPRAYTAITEGLASGFDVRPYISKQTYRSIAEWIIRAFEISGDTGATAVANYLHDDLARSNYLSDLTKSWKGGHNFADVVAYLEAGYTAEQAEILLDDQRSGIDTSVYENPEFDAAQMEVLRKGIQKGLDVSSIADPSIPAKQMEDMLLKLQGADVMTPEQLEQIIEENDYYSRAIAHANDSDYEQRYNTPKSFAGYATKIFKRDLAEWLEEDGYKVPSYIAELIPKHVITKLRKEAEF